MKYNAKIYYTIDKNHPDIEYVKDWTEDKEFDFSDTYTFNDEIYENEDEEMILNYIKKDLRLIAGGGYNSEHIHNVRFEIKRIY